MKIGIISWFNQQKGFGFAVSEDKPRSSYFIHRTAFVNMAEVKTLIAGTKIQFEVSQRDSFTEALNAGDLRDAPMNPRNPSTSRKDCPKALRIRVVQL